MYEATLEPISNREDWIGTFEMIDDTTGEVITDLTGVSMVLEVRERRTHCVVLSATNDNGKVVDAGSGVLQWHFPLTDMTGLCAGSYLLGITISRDDLTSQQLIGVIPVMDGIVSR